MSKRYLKQVSLRLFMFPGVFTMSIILFIPFLILFGENIIGNMIDFYKETNEMFN